MDDGTDYADSKGLTRPGKAAIGGAMTEGLREFLFGRINYEHDLARPHNRRSFSLDGIRRLLGRMGNPERAYRVIHVAGTKGKGSTATLIAQILRAHDLSVGLYTSPHLVDLEERFWVNGRMIPSADLDSQIARIRSIVEQPGDPIDNCQNATFFEITTATAFRYFAERQVDVAVIEVGLGGRLDATNVCHPDVAVITNIGFDHTNLLGKRLADIAREKAGIIKPGIPVVSGEMHSEPADVIARVADVQKAPLYRAGIRFGHQCFRPGPTAARNRDKASNRETFDFWMNGPFRDTAWDALRLSICGRHQFANAAVALAAADLFRRDEPLDESSVRSALQRCRMPARIEWIDEMPPTIVDMAHNLPSLVALTETLDQIYPDRSRSLAFGVSRDKNLVGMIEHISKNFDRLVLSRFVGNPRSAAPSELARIAIERCRANSDSRLRPDRIVIAEDPASAWMALRRIAQNDDLLCVAGSAFFAAEMKTSLKAQRHASAV